MADVRELDNLLYLLRCAIHKRKPNLDRVRAMDLDRLYALSRFHSLAALTYTALSSAWDGHPPQDTLPAGWKETRDTAVRDALLFAAERRALEAFCEKQGIWYLPLKGILLQDDYPGLGMREMADNDILFDPAFQEQLHDWFVARGYEVAAYRTGVHDSYHKAPIFNFEMHTALFDETTYPAWDAFFAGALDRAQIQEGTRCQRRFTQEDFFLHVLAHMYKHFEGGGTGLRSLLDLYLFRQAHGQMLDKRTLNQGLEALDLTDFAHESCALADRIFGREAPLQPEDAQTLTYYLASGTYGTAGHRVQNQLKKIAGENGAITGRTKGRYVCQRFFPDRDFMERWCRSRAPVFLRHPVLMPLAPWYRLVHTVFAGRGKSILQELRSLWKQK